MTTMAIISAPREPLEQAQIQRIRRATLGLADILNDIGIEQQSRATENDKSKTK